MATIKQGILGGFSGKVGAVVGGTWKGISFMRGLTQNVKNPRTEKQVGQRTKFSLAIEFLQPMTAYVRTGYKTYANGQTGFNAAMSHVLKNAITGTYPDYSIDFQAVYVSRGSLVPAKNAAATVSGGKISMTWTDNSGEGDALETDVAMPLVFNKDKKQVVYSTSAASRGDTTLELDLPADWVGDSVEAYLGFMSDDGQRVSNSVYLGEETVA